MKAILAFVILLVSAIPALADVAVPAEQPTATAEVITIGAGTVLGLANVAMIGGRAPSYMVGGASVAAGITALALTTVDNPAHETGLFASGVAAIASGLVAMRYRHVLSRRMDNARIAPAWNDGGPGLALTIDF